METANVLLNNTQAFNRNCTAILDVHLPAFTYLLNPGAHVFIPVFRVASDFSSWKNKCDGQVDECQKFHFLSLWLVWLLSSGNELSFFCRLELAHLAHPLGKMDGRWLRGRVSQSDIEGGGVLKFATSHWSVFSNSGRQTNNILPKRKIGMKLYLHFYIQFLNKKVVSCYDYR